MDTFDNIQVKSKISPAVLHFIGLICLICFVGALFLGSGWTALFFSVTAALAAVSLIYLIATQVEPDLIMLRLLILSFGTQILAVFLITVSGAPTAITSSTLEIDLLDYPISAVFPLLIIPATALLVTLVVRLLWPTSYSRRSVLLEVEQAPRVIETFLILAATISVAYWLAALPGSGNVGYLVRVINSAFVLVPCVAGRYANRSNRIRYAWFAAMAINVCVGLIVGSRQTALLAPSLYAIGMISGLEGDKRKIAIGMCLALGMPIIFISGIVGVVRDEIGRGGIEIVSDSRIKEFYTTAMRVFDEGLFANSEIKFQGFARMLAFTNAMVPVVTPSIIPYRGFAGIMDDAANSAQIAAVSDLTREDVLDAGLATAPARDYGFMINKENSVEFGILPDAWSRGGFSVAVLFGLVISTILILTERGVNRIFLTYPQGMLVALSVVARTAFFESTGQPLLFVIRGLILNLCLIFFLIVVLRLTVEEEATPSGTTAQPKNWTLG